MDERDHILNSIIADMQNTLSTEQIERLKQSLVREMEHVTVTKRTQLAVADSFEEDKRLINSYITPHFLERS